MKWTACFKTRRGHTLWWLSCFADSETEAQEKIQKKIEGTDYRLYGGVFPVTK